MHDDGVGRAALENELTDRLEEGQPLDITGGSADLSDHVGLRLLALDGFGMRSLISLVMCGTTCTVLPR